MKKLFLVALFLTKSAFAQDRCPAIAGEFIAFACPKSETAYSTVMIHQMECRAIGFQKITYRADHTPISWGAVSWEPVGLGKLLKGETDKIATYVERFYDSDSLYAYSFDQDKVSKEITYKGSEIIDLLPNGNLFVSYSSSGMSQTMISMGNCP